LHRAAEPHNGSARQFYQYPKPPIRTERKAIRMSQENAWQTWLPVLETELDKEMQKAPAVSAVHATDHIHRVWQRCLKIGQSLGADLAVLAAATYLHDLGRHYIQDKAHGALSAKLAEPVLERIFFPEERKEAVLHAIRVHDVTAGPQDRKTLEARILYDCDKLETMGVIGVLRYIVHFYGKASIDYMLEDIDARWNGLCLPETRTYAMEDYRYIKNYFERLKQALDA
jgi:HD superfamily phosphodiesterase